MDSFIHILIYFPYFRSEWMTRIYFSNSESRQKTTLNKKNRTRHICMCTRTHIQKAQFRPNNRSKMNIFKLYKEAKF